MSRLPTGNGARHLPPDGEPVGVISPHMDDAALSCGDLLGRHPGSHVVTVFASGPARVDPLPEWDALAGVFRPGDDVMALRAVEDDQAMAVVGATGHRLGFWDEQYRAGAPVRHAWYRPWAAGARQARLDDPQLRAQIDASLADVVEGLTVSTWFVPLGLWHGDHFKTAQAALRLAARHPEVDWVVYEELPYRNEVPGQVGPGHERAAAAGFALQALAEVTPGAASLKRAMLSCYRSQLPCLGARAEAALAAPEVYQALRPLGAAVPAEGSATN